jgi:EAL domain-containing protein (putative c-di-GMP-specific phosphodiesterase class I)
VAEGVEDEFQLAALRELGCTKFQGYYWGEPAEADATSAMLSNVMCPSQHREVARIV